MSYELARRGRARPALPLSLQAPTRGASTPQSPDNRVGFLCR
jgi:hypothetical protein